MTPWLLTLLLLLPASALADRINLTSGDTIDVDRVSVALAKVVTIPERTAAPPVATKAALLVYWDTQKREAIEGMRRTITAQALCRSPGCFELATTRQLKWTQQWIRATQEYDAASRP